MTRLTAPRPTVLALVGLLALPVLPEPAAAQMADDWSQYLGNFRRAISACRARAVEYDTVVTKGTPMTQGLVGVRLRTVDGRRFDCIAEAGGAVQRIDPVAADAADLPEEGRPVFVPNDRPQPRSGCVRAVTLSDGQALGWLHYAAAC